MKDGIEEILDKDVLEKRYKVKTEIFVILIVFTVLAFAGTLALLFKEKPNTDIDLLVGFFYPYSAKTVSRDVLIQQIKVITSTEYPELALAIAYRESRFNPSAVSSAGAKGTFQVMPSWVESLIKDGVIQEERDLHDPTKGCLAGVKVLGYHLVKANGDIMAALRDYVGSKDKATNVSYVRDVLATYGNIKLLLVAHNSDKLVVKDVWWEFKDVDDLHKQVNPTKKGKP